MKNLFLIFLLSASVASAATSWTTNNLLSAETTTNLVNSKATGNTNYTKQVGQNLTNYVDAAILGFSSPTNGVTSNQVAAIINGQVDFDFILAALGYNPATNWGAITFQNLSTTNGDGNTYKILDHNPSTISFGNLDGMGSSPSLNIIADSALGTPSIFINGTDGRIGVLLSTNIPGVEFAVNGGGMFLEELNVGQDLRSSNTVFASRGFMMQARDDDPTVTDMTGGGSITNTLFWIKRNAGLGYGEPYVTSARNGSGTDLVQQKLLTEASVLSSSNLPAMNYIASTNGSGRDASLFGTLFTSNQVITLDNLGTTIVPILSISNGASSSLGAQQASGGLMMYGHGWRSGNSTDMPVGMGMYVLPVQGSSANPTARLTIMQSISNAAPASTGTYFSDSGSIVAGSGLSGNTITSSGDIGIGSTYSLYWQGSRMALYSPSNLRLALTTSAFSSVASALDNWLGLTIEATTNNPTLGIRTSGNTYYASLVASNVFAQYQGVYQPLNAHASITMIGDETVDLVSQSTYYSITNYDHSFTNLMGANTAIGTITNSYAGYYNIRMTGSGLGTTASANLYECGVFTNNVECTLIEWQRTVTSTARGSFAAEGTIYLPAGCWINARIKSDAASPDDFTFGQFTLTVSSP